MTARRGESDEIIVIVRPMGRREWRQASYWLADVHDLKLVDTLSSRQRLHAWVWCNGAADDNGDPVHACDGRKGHQAPVNIAEADNADFKLLVGRAAS